MRVSFILAAIVIIVIVFGFRVLLGRSSTLGSRTIGASAMDKVARKWDSKRYDDAAEALAASLDVWILHEEQGDPVGAALRVSWPSTPGTPTSRRRRQ